MKTGVPVQVDHYRIEAKGIDINELVVNYPPKKTTWSLLLKGITNPNKNDPPPQDRRNRGSRFLWSPCSIRGAGTIDLRALTSKAPARLVDPTPAPTPDLSHVHRPRESSGHPQAARHQHVV